MERESGEEWKGRCVFEERESAEGGVLSCLSAPWELGQGPGCLHAPSLSQRRREKALCAQG